MNPCRHLAPVLALCLAAGSLRADDELAIRASWKAPAAAAVKAQVEAWAANQKLAAALQARIAAIFAGESQGADELLQRTVECLAVGSVEAAQVVDLCCQPTAPLVLPKFAILTDEKQPPLMRHALRLHFGRWLIEHELYDEALSQVAGLAPGDVIDPAGLLFQRAVLHHHFLDKKNLSATVALMTENPRDLPRRYLAVARLLEADLGAVAPDSLDEIARLMRDVGRQLDRGRAGTKVRRTEDEVVKKLEKLIDELEDPPTPRTPRPPGSRPNQPKDETVPGGPKGAGAVDPKEIGRKDGWGNLPPQDRQQVLQELSKDLPAHYREVIEQYFRRLARDQKD